MYWINRFISRIVEAMLIEKMAWGQRNKELALWVSVKRGGTVGAKACKEQQEASTAGLGERVGKPKA